MTNALALAERVYPDAPWQFDTMHGIVYDERDGTQFDPRNNPAQALDVLAWLLQRDSEITGSQVEVWSENGWERKIRIDHDGTALSLVRAVVAAAERVAEDGKV